MDGYLKYVSNYVKVLNSEIGDLTDLKILRDHLAGDDLTDVYKRQVIILVTL